MNTQSIGRRVGRRVRSAGSRLASNACSVGARTCVAVTSFCGEARDCWTTKVARVMGAALALLVALVLAPIARATDPPSLLPDTGIDIEAMVTEVVTTLGGIVAVIVAAFFAFLLIRKALRWARSGF